jgi:hypothetical protein
MGPEAAREDNAIYSWSLTSESFSEDPLWSFGAFFAVYTMTHFPKLWILVSTIMALIVGCARQQCIWAIPWDKDLVMEVSQKKEEIVQKLMNKELVEDPDSWICWKRGVVDILIFATTASAYLDIVLDLSNLWSLLSTEHYIFSGIKGIFIVLGTWHMLREGPGRLALEAWRSWEIGMYTEKYTELIMLELSLEAVPTMIVDLYAYPYVADSGYATAVFGLSALMSINGLAGQAVLDFDLGIESFAGAESDEEDHDEENSSLASDEDEAPSHPRNGM